MGHGIFDSVSVGTGVAAAQPLQVFGHTANEIARFQPANLAQDLRGFISLYTTNPAFWWELSNQGPAGNGALNGLAFRERSVSDPSIPRLYLAQGGRVGMGTTTPDGQLSVTNDLGNTVVQLQALNGPTDGKRGVTLGYGPNYNGIFMAPPGGEIGFLQVDWPNHPSGRYRPLYLNPLGGQVWIGRASESGPVDSTEGPTSRFIVTQQVIRGSAVMADFVLDVTGSGSAGEFADSGAGRFVVYQNASQPTGNAMIRALEAHAVRGVDNSPPGGGVASNQTWGLEVGVHSQVSAPGDPVNRRVGIYVASSHQGWLSTGVRNNTGILVTGEDGWDQGLLYVDTDGSTQLFKVTGTGNVVITGSYQQASSRAYKEDIESLSAEEAADTVARLTPRTFKYRQQPEREYRGFIAEETPDVLTSADGKSINVMDVVATLTRVVQEQQKAIAALEVEVAALKARCALE